MATPRWLNADEDRAWRGLRRAQLVVLAAINRDLRRDSNLSEADYEVFTHLSETENDRARFGDLAGAMRWSTSRLSHHLDRMQQRGLVGRSERDDDGRGADIVLTPLGRRTVEAAAAIHVESVRNHLFDHLTATQVRQLGEITDALLAHHDPALTVPSRDS